MDIPVSLEKPKKVEKQHTLEEFILNTDKYFLKLEKISDSKNLLILIASNFAKLSNSFMMMGNHYHKKNDDPITTYNINYKYAENFKDLLILHRDVYLEFHKVQIINKEKSIPIGKSTAHFEKSKEVLIGAVEHFKNSITFKSKTLIDDKKTTKSVVQKLSLHQNPWEIYVDQYDNLLIQIKEIKEYTEDLLITIGHFNKIKTTVKQLEKNHINLIQKCEDSISHIAKTLKANENEKLLDFVEEQLVNLQHLGNNHVNFSEQLNAQIQTLKTIDVPISSQDGMLAIRVIDFNKSVQKWFDYQILPNFMDLISLETNLKSNVNLSYLNLKNSLQLAKEAESTENISIFENTIANLNEKINNIKADGALLRSEILKNVKEELRITNLLKGKSFLDVPINTSLSIGGNTFFKNISEFFSEGKSLFKNQFKKSINHEYMSDFELATQCMSHRMTKDDNSHYDAIFLNKKFIGNLFLVPRNKQEKKLNIIIDQWKKGFNKSVCIKGDRLSGKSTFLDYTSKKYFGKDIVILRPDSDATIDGRKFSTSKDLKEALRYLKNNNTKSTKPCVIIDDLELWHDKEHHFLANVRALQNFIQTESDETFVMVSTSNIMFEHLEKRMQFSITFTNSIDINFTEPEEIHEAILLRHGAAQRELITQDLQLVSHLKIQKIIEKLSKRNKYNLGNTLQAWTFNTFVQENEQILFKDTFCEFPNYFSDNELIILKRALQFKTFNEYGIKQLTTTAFDTEFKPALRNLINAKVLIRNSKGLLFVNPVVVQAIEAIIKKL